MAKPSSEGGEGVPLMRSTLETHGQTCDVRLTQEEIHWSSASGDATTQDRRPRSKWSVVILDCREQKTLTQGDPGSIPCGADWGLLSQTCQRLILAYNPSKVRK